MRLFSIHFNPSAQDWCDDKLKDAAWYLTPLGLFRGAAVVDDCKTNLRANDQLCLHLSWSPDGTGSLRFTLNGNHVQAGISGIRGAVYLSCQLLNRRDAIEFVAEEVFSATKPKSSPRSKGERAQEGGDGLVSHDEAIALWSQGVSRPDYLQDWGTGIKNELPGVDDQTSADTHSAGNGAANEQSPAAEPSHTGGLHDEGIYRQSLNEHHDRLQALHSILQHLDDAISGGHDVNVKEVVQKLRQELAEVHDHYLQGPHHPSHWRNPGGLSSSARGEYDQKLNQRQHDQHGYDALSNEAHQNQHQHPQKPGHTAMDAPLKPGDDDRDHHHDETDKRLGIEDDDIKTTSLSMANGNGLETLMEDVSKLQAELRVVVAERDSLRSRVQRQLMTDLDKNRSLQQYELSLQDLQARLEQFAAHHSRLTMEYQQDITRRAVTHDSLFSELQKTRSELFEQRGRSEQLEQQVLELQDHDFGGKTWQRTSVSVVGGSSSRNSSTALKNNKLLKARSVLPSQPAKKGPIRAELYNMRPRLDSIKAQSISAPHSPAFVSRPAQRMAATPRLDSSKRNREALLAAAARDDVEAVAGILALANDERRAALAAQALGIAAKNGSESVCTRLAAGECGEEAMDAAVFCAAKAGQRRILDLLVERGCDPLTATDGDSASPLIVAAYHGQLEVVHQLLQMGVDRGIELINQVDREGYTGENPIFREGCKNED